MTKDIAEYENRIWNIFSVGIISSVLILYEVYKNNNFSGNIKIFPLILGFSILVYCFFAILGYGTKKKELIKILEEEKDKLVLRLKGRFYSRSRWMGEGILILIGIYYLIAFIQINLAFIFIPIAIVILAIFTCLFANTLSKIEE